MHSVHTSYLCVSPGFRKKSDYFPTNHYLIDPYTADGVCLPRGTMGDLVYAAS